MPDYEVGDVVVWDKDGEVPPSFIEANGEGPFIVRGFWNNGIMVCVNSMSGNKYADKSDFYTYRFKKHPFLSAARKAVLEGRSHE